MEIPQDLQERGYHDVIHIYVSCEMSQPWLQYIQDCWTDYVIGDLGCAPHELLMVTPDLG